MEFQLLFEELLPSQAELINESSADGKSHWLSGIFMQAEVKNQNGRIYPLSEISNAVESVSARLSTKNFITGELDHPQTLRINLDRVSHIITDLRMEGNNAVGRAKLLDTPMGLIAQKLIEGGVRMGVSSRGAGAVSEAEGGVVSGFQFVTVDLVAQPSAPDAYPSAVYESLYESKHGHNIIKLAESVKQDPAAQKYFEKAITKWLSENLFAKR